MTALSPIESEFATTEEAEAYDHWFRQKVEAAMKDTRPGIPHDEVMAELRAITGDTYKTLFDRRQRVVAGDTDEEG